MQAPDVRCGGGGLLVGSAVLRLRPRCERNVHCRPSCSVAPNDPADPDGVNAAIHCSPSSNLEAEQHSG
jgi:hypothetical protein